MILVIIYNLIKDEKSLNSLIESKSLLSNLINYISNLTTKMFNQDGLDYFNNEVRSILIKLLIGINLIENFIKNERKLLGKLKQIKALYQHNLINLLSYLTFAKLNDNDDDNTQMFTVISIKSKKILLKLISPDEVDQIFLNYQ